MRAWVGGVAVLGPGLPDWAASEAVLAGEQPWQMTEAAAPAPAILPSTERRRTSATVRFALAVATEATAEEPDRAALETIFASANGDGATVTGILNAMHEPEGAISPTQFHNSVHNAAAGYWHIAVGSTAPSVSMGGHDGAFAAGLLSAMAGVAARGRPVLLCAYDMPMPPPLASVQPTAFPFAVAMVLHPAPGERTRAMLELRYVAGGCPGEPPCGEGLDALAAGNPAARSLPLLRALAARKAALARLALTADSHLEVRVAPC
ncbi:MAG TPA: beta-ketoacyl synthase chain length factor [Falsiroseomonas sp.]|jgi:hypothetical protein|nr:beta-ketoacyl synthase chain length factor [Falsiroseomonas sp.]